jgi:hypothetical protein
MESFETLREEVEVTLRDALAARSSLMVAVENARRQAFEAAQRFENFCLRVARGTRHGQDPLTGAVRQLLENARAERDRAAGALSRVQRELDNTNWRIDCCRAELSQLELVVNPPVEGRTRLYEVAKRPRPPGFDVVGDNIIFPRPPDDAA